MDTEAIYQEKLMKKHQTAKYKKRHKKELANLKAKQLAGGKEIQPVAKPISPARRAFQDV